MSKNKKKENPKKGSIIEESTERSIPKKINYWLPLLLILVITFIAYSPTFENELVDWDDNFYLETNTLITEGKVAEMFQLNFIHAIKAAYDKEARETLDKSSFVSGNYHPLTIYSLYLNFQFSKLNPNSYQLTNILLHLINVILVFLLLKRILPDKRFAIFIGTALFALHPMHVESVSWISERKDVLYSVFFLLGLLSYFKFREKRQLLFLLATYALFFASCLSKPAAVVFPMVIILIDFYIDRKIFLKRFLRYIPMLAISTVFGLITLSAQVDSGAVGKIWHLSQFEQIVLAGHSVILYLFKFFIPFELCAFYPIPSSVDGIMYINFFLSILILFFVLKYRLKDLNITFGFMFFFINLLLILQVVSVGSAMIADRYTYLPYIGLSIIVGVFLEKLLNKWKSKLLVIYFPIGFLFLLTSLTFNRTKIWKNTRTLFSDVIAKEPNQWLGWGKRGMYFKELGNEQSDSEERFRYHTRALEDFNKALKLDPDNKLRLERGDILFNRQMYREALEDFKVRFSVGDTSAILLTNMATSVYKLNNKTDAFKFYAKALSSDSTFKYAYFNRGIDYFSEKEYSNSLSDFKKYVFFDSINGGVYYTMGLCQKRLGNHREAVMYYTKAIEFYPSERELAKYYFDRGLSNYLIGNLQDSKSDIQSAQSKGYEIPDFLVKEFDL